MTFTFFLFVKNIRDVQSENSSLSTLILKMRTMNDWKRTGVRSFYGKKIHQVFFPFRGHVDKFFCAHSLFTQASAEADSYKKALWEYKLLVCLLEVSIAHRYFDQIFLQSDESKSQQSYEIGALREELERTSRQLESVKASLMDEKSKKLALQQWKHSKQGLLAQVCKMFSLIKALWNPTRLLHAGRGASKFAGVASRAANHRSSARVGASAGGSAGIVPRQGATCACARDCRV
jgi:hypothetical protein